MSALISDQLSFGWSPDDLLFESLSFAIERERVALVGPNGTGKTTLIKLLVGELNPLSGHVRRPEKWLYLSQVTDASMTIADALGIDRKLSAITRVEEGSTDQRDYDAIGDDWDLEDRANRVLESLDLSGRPWSEPLSSLSGGQVMQLRLARARLEEPDLLILDEPTNDLDRAGLDRLYALVEGWSSGLLIVSHDRSLLTRVDRILELGPLGLNSYGGGYDLYHVLKIQEREVAERRLLDAEKAVKHATRQAQARKERTERRAALGKRNKTGSLPPVMIGNLKRRAQTKAGKSTASADRRINEAKSQVDAARGGIEIRNPLAFEIVSSGLSARKQVLSVEDLRVSFGAQTTPVLDRFNLKIIGPERLAITGANGSGKSTLLRAIGGEIAADGGTITVGVERLAFLRQNTSILSPERTLVEHFVDRNPNVSIHQARAALARFGFRNRAADQIFGELSGGEGLRASLAITMMAQKPPQLLILDEPTNHMDLQSIETLERALSAYDGALIVVSHDRRFLDAINLDRCVEI